MKLQAVKELVVKDLAIVALGVLASLIRLIDKVSKEEGQEIRLYKVKTKNYHVRLLVDKFCSDSLVLYRPKGFLKDWTCLTSKDIPECISRCIFEDSCTKENRKRLVNKIVELKAFW